MKNILCARYMTIWIGLSVGITAFLPNAAVGEGDAVEGRTLFKHRWTPKDKLSPNGDGLGPMRNAASCVECHFQGGTGGGGPNEKNVDLLSAVAKTRKEVRNPRLFRSKLPRIHAGFTDFGSNHSIVLHRFGANEDYEFFRLRMLGVPLRDEMTEQEVARVLRTSARRLKRRPPVMDVRLEGTTFRVTQRNTPALFGSDLIDKIKVETVLEIARNQSKRAPSVSGRVPPAGGFGRFGWRGQTSTLKDFVLGACANELGLQSPDNEQAPNPLDKKYVLSGEDLSEKQCDNLIAFVRDLPRPTQIKPARRSQLNLVNYGERLFHSIGCDVCHVPNVGTVEGLYSDLLLHDMGSDLADPLPALPQIVHAGKQIVTVTGGYFGGTSTRSIDRFEHVPTNLHQEWRTPPLWGVRDSAPYLHDGRAATLAEAISLHGGEARFSANSFRSLPAQDRSMLIAFLNTLAAPRNQP